MSTPDLAGKQIPWSQLQEFINLYKKSIANFVESE
jgi:hypothetical protein